MARRTKATKTKPTSREVSKADLEPKKTAPEISASDLAQGLVEFADLARSYSRASSPVREDERAALQAILTTLAKHRRRPRARRFRTTRISRVGRRLAWARVAADAVVRTFSLEEDSEARQASIAAELAVWLSRSGFDTSVDSVRQVIDELRTEATHEVAEDWIVANNGPVEAAGLIVERVLKKVVRGASRNNTRKLRQVLEAELDAGAFVEGPRNDVEFLTFLLKALGVSSETAVETAASLTTSGRQGVPELLEADIRAAKAKSCSPARPTAWWATLTNTSGK